MIAKTQSGLVRGMLKDGVRVWRGIPYATAPRFQPPGPPETWTGERDATKFGPVAVQSRDPRIAMMSGVTDKIQMSEDCLSVNITAPDRDGPHPVLVWFHGGAFIMGSGSTPLYDGRSFASRHGIVVVTLNYRIGILGFHGGNHALLDQVAALTWVRDNIAAFGGDPAQVTAMGESAGGMSVACLLGMPAARGLFHRAILESGAGSLSFPTEAPEIDIANDATVDEILAAQAKLALEKGLGAFQPYVDGVAVPKPPHENLAIMPVLLGTNRDEWKLFSTFLGRGAAAGFEAPLRARLGDKFDALLAAYNGDWDDLIGDVVFRMPTLRLADHLPSYVYRFDWHVPNGPLGAAHALELPFVWNTLELPASQFLLGGDVAGAKPLATAMHDSWAAFAKTGDPNGGGLPAWPRYDVTRPTMLLDRTCSVALDPGGERRSIWAGLY
jgi:para-nitrobenzyl esterase